MAEKLSTGLAPVAGPGAKLLILGSMPGQASLEEQQYYAHPRNSFWPIMESLLDLPSGLSYDERCSALAGRGIALWNVLQACERSGSLDSSIIAGSMVANDFAAFFASHPSVEALFFNGLQVDRLYRRLILPCLGAREAALPRLSLPATSPANARLRFSQKLEQWRAISIYLA